MSTPVFDRYAALDAHLLSHTGAVRDYKPEWGWFRYQVGGKMFAAILTPGTEHGAYARHTLLTLKCDPLMGELLRQQYDAVLPAFYMDKRHWISICLDGNVPEELLRGLCTASHRLVFEKLPKKVQRELTTQQ